MATWLVILILAYGAFMTICVVGVGLIVFTLSCDVRRAERSRMKRSLKDGDGK